ncbi:unnamed protein product, partial [Ectocarpus sp. 12 AP-2014]
VTAPSDLILRNYGPDDRDQVIALWDSCGLLVWYNDPDKDIARWIENPSSEILLGVLGESVVASICVGNDGHRGRLNYLACAEEHQGKGYASSMVSAAEDWLRARNV